MYGGAFVSVVSKTGKRRLRIAHALALPLNMSRVRSSLSVVRIGLTSVESARIWALGWTSEKKPAR